MSLELSVLTISPQLGSHLSEITFYSNIIWSVKQISREIMFGFALALPQTWMLAVNGIELRMRESRETIEYNETLNK